MWPREFATPFWEFAFLSDLARPKKTPLQEVTSPLLEKPLPRDKTLRFFYLIANFCANSRFEGLKRQEIKWPRSLQPNRSFETSALSPRDFRTELQEALDLKSSRDGLNVCFGFLWTNSQADQTLEVKTFFPHQALLIVAKEKCNHAVILEATLKQKGRWETTATVFSPCKAGEFSGHNVSPRKLKGLLAETAELAVRCAELELRSKETP